MRCSALIAVCGALCAISPPSSARSDADDVLRMALSPAVLEARLERFVPVQLGIEPTAVAPEIAPMLEPLRRAADRIDAVFWRQHAPEARRLLPALDGSNQAGAVALARLLRVHYGPWDAFASDAPFLGTAPRPPGVGYYPADLTRGEVDAWIHDNPESAAELWSPYTVVVRREGRLEALPYSLAYEADLRQAASALREAAGSYGCDGDACPCAGLVRYLKARARSLLNDDYATSERVWLSDDRCPLDVAIGPYEFYADRLLGLKAAFEAILYHRADGDTKRFARLRSQHESLIAALPLDDALRRRFVTLPPAPITVADVLYTGGEARASMQIRAFLLPNDEHVRKTHGTRSVILRNVVRAKFDHLVKPVARDLLGERGQKLVSFHAYYDFLLAWQLAHSVAPAPITDPEGRMVTSRQLLQARHTPIDAVKGEAVAMLNWRLLRDRGLVTKETDETMAATYLASLFDSARLAEGSPQTLAKVVVYNHLAEAGVFRYDAAAHRYTVDAGPLPAALTALARQVLGILAAGDYDAAGRLIVKSGIMPAEMRQKLAALDRVPIEILPEYVSVPTAAR